MEMNELNEKIAQWFAERGITANGKMMGQAIKTLEETTELIDAINKNDEAEIKDAIGDIYVTILGVCQVAGYDIDKCIEGAYNEIKDRTGYLTPEGIFVKDA